jgi:hypothetical protein
MGIRLLGAAGILFLGVACSGAANVDIGAQAHERDATADATKDKGDVAVVPQHEATTGDDVGDTTTLEAGGDDAAMEAAVEPAEGGEPPESGPSLCSRLCVMGCCDGLGKCRQGNSVMLCGAAGAMCQDCSTHQCLLASAPCCKLDGTCGCAVGGLVGCN